MSDKSLSGRTFPAAGSLLATLPVLPTPFARAQEPGLRIDIDTVKSSDWVASFRKAFNEAQTVVVPAGIVCDEINTAITIPPGKSLYIQGEIRGNGKGRFILQDGCEVRGEKGETDQYYPSTSGVLIA